MTGEATGFWGSGDCGTAGDAASAFDVERSTIRTSGANGLGSGDVDSAGLEIGWTGAGVAAGEAFLEVSGTTVAVVVALLELGAKNRVNSGTAVTRSHCVESLRRT